MGILKPKITIMLHTELLKGKHETYEIRHDSNGNATHAIISHGKATIYESLNSMIKHHYFGHTKTKRYKLNEDDLDELYGEEYSFSKLEDKMKELENKSKGDIDLFSRPERLPDEVSKLLHAFWRFAGDEYDVDILEVFKSRLNKLGYTFDYGLDLTPFNLREFGSVEI
jgi:hypothetical protein